MAVEILFEYGDKLNCQTCDDKLKEERGHDKEGIVPFWVDGKWIKRCPLMMITPLSWEYIKAFGFYENSFLPNGKGWCQESERYITAMTILRNEFQKAREKIKENTSRGKNAYNRFVGKFKA